MAAEETLAESNILNIVEQDLISHRTRLDAPDMKVVSIKKVAIPSRPYVIWKLLVTLNNEIGGWDYKINAFSGEVLEKKRA
jgi:hypothetical protein